MEETRVPGENNRPVASHWQTKDREIILPPKIKFQLVQQNTIQYNKKIRALLIYETKNHPLIEFPEPLYLKWRSEILNIVTEYVYVSTITKSKYTSTIQWI